MLLSDLGETNFPSIYKQPDRMEKSDLGGRGWEGVGSVRPALSSVVQHYVRKVYCAFQMLIFDFSFV